jgi:hypothetical protein
VENENWKNPREEKNYGRVKLYLKHMPVAAQQENSLLAEVVAVIQQQTTSAFSHTALLTQIGLCL